MTFATVMEMAKETFFPGGVARNSVLLTDVECMLGDFASKPLHSFGPENDYTLENHYTYADFLKTVHLFPSRTTLYFMIKQKTVDCDSEGPTAKTAKVSQECEISETIDMSIAVEEEMSDINITYRSFAASRFDGEIISTLCFGRKQCLEHCTKENINPVNCGFIVTDISKGNKFFLKSDLHGNNGDYPTIYNSFPSADFDKDVILHHPDEVFSWDDGVLVLGIVSKFHNNPTVNYAWMKDGALVRAGPSCLLNITESGVYTCILTIENVSYLSWSATVSIAEHQVFRAVSNTHALSFSLKSSAHDVSATEASLAQVNSSTALSPSMKSSAQATLATEASLAQVNSSTALSSSTKSSAQAKSATEASLAQVNSSTALSSSTKSSAQAKSATEASLAQVNYCFVI